MSETTRPEWMQPTEAGKILGVNERRYPDGGAYDIPYACLRTVLVQGDIGDYAAYQGINSDAVWIARHGDKIGFEEACAHFPGGQLVAERYRA